ncbi:MAG: CDP-alcohol phosphatidyltransferase family protein [Acidobacteriota bacterium]
MASRSATVCRDLDECEDRVGNGSTRIAERAAAWLVHLLTASGAVLGLLAMAALHEGRIVRAFWLMAVALIIDSADGTLARRFQVGWMVPSIDGALLDNIVDYLNYVMVPAFFLMVTDLLPPAGRIVAVGALVLASAYQFCHIRAKTEDHFFLGFPCYWNFVVFYLFLWQTPAWFNLAAILILVGLVFVPIKYVYPSRMEYVTKSRGLRRAMLWISLLYGAATLALLWIYPDRNLYLVGFSVLYVAAYAAVSFYRTLVPLR